MKILKLTLPLLLLSLLLVVTISAKSTPDAQTLSAAIQKSCPARFGYVDNTQYYMSSYFSDLKDVEDFCIATAADSTDFSQIGVFRMKSNSSIATNKKMLSDYVKHSKKTFENGIVYNTQEYPKFENATVIGKDNYLVYVILDKEGVKNAEKVINEWIG